jgi:hypothetical protein
VWVLAWVAHALVACPTQLVSPPINFPAPNQLTGTEHFGSSQLLFAPVFWLTGNAVLGANLVAFLCYPLAAFAMQRLLLALGCRSGVAWVGGLLFALGPLRVPAQLHALQYPNLFLPLVALGLVRLFERPSTGRAMLLFVALLLGLFASYYVALLITVVAVVWVVYEIACGLASWRAITFAAAAGGGALLLLAVASRSYLAQAEAFDRTSTFARHLAVSLGAVDPAPLEALGFLVAGFWGRPWQVCWGPLPLLFTALGLRAALSRNAGGVWRIAVLGLAYCVIGSVLMLGPRVVLAGHAIPLPFRAVELSPARFFRVPFRFAVVVGFGTVLLAGAGLEHASRSIGAVRARAALVAVSALGVLLTIGIHLCDSPLVPIRAAGAAAPVYDRVGAIVRRIGEGPMAEMPARSYRRLENSGAERRVGSTRHWLPSILDYTGYPSEHTLLVQDALLRLPDEEALADVVDMTHLRWLLLRPREEWHGDGIRERFLGTLVAEGAVSQVVDIDGWLLVRLARDPHHPEWFAAIAAGRAPGTTVLGTPLEALAPSAAVGHLTVESPPGDVAAGKAAPIRVAVTNLGDATWPVLVPMVTPAAASTDEMRLDRYSAVLVTRWVTDDGEGATARPQTFRLRRDVPPGETLHDEIAPLAPTRPGRYHLEVQLEQVGGTHFTGPDGGGMRLPVVVR